MGRWSAADIPDLTGRATTNGSIPLDPFDEGLEEEEDAQAEGPLKANITEDQLPLHLRLAFVDFCGLHDNVAWFKIG